MVINVVLRQLNVMFIDAEQGAVKCQKPELGQAVGADWCRWL